MEHIPEGGKVAVYIDFDNIVISHYNATFGARSFSTDNAWNSPKPFVKQRLAEAHISLDAILDYASSFGSIIISRAYANWADSSSRAYSKDTMKRAIDLVQLFPMSGTKNGADIRLAIDVVDDVLRHGDITHVVVVAGDSDYVALAQRCKRLGRQVIGVGVGESVGKYWESACDEFRYYATLPGLADSPAEVTSDKRAGTGREPLLLVRAARVLAAKSETGWINASALKLQMKRLDASFDEKTLGYTSFRAFLDSCTTVIEVAAVDSQVQVRLLGSDPATDPVAPSATAGVDEELTARQADYRRCLGLPAAGGLGTDGEALTIRAMHKVWSLDATGLTLTTTVLTKALLEGESTDSTLAKRVAHLTLTSGLPLRLRPDGTEDAGWIPNPELQALSDDELTVLLRHWAMNRVRNNTHPESVDPHDVAVALYGSACIPDGAITDFTAALDHSGYAIMGETLGELVLPTTVLWDVLDSIVDVPSTTTIGSPDALGIALREPLERRFERVLSDEQVAVAYRMLRAGEILTDTEHGAVNAFAGAGFDDAFAQVVRSWAKTLADRGAFDHRQLLDREAFYRLVIQERYRADWREWVHKLLT